MPPTLYCPTCVESIPFAGVSQLKAHYFEVHYKLLPFKCFYCAELRGGQFPTEETLRHHYNDVHGAEPRAEKYWVSWVLPKTIHK